MTTADRLTYLGHATTELRLAGASVLTDPVLRDRVGPLRRRRRLERWEGAGLEAVLISHLHRDHLDLPSLRRLPGAVTAVVPRGAADLVAGAVSGEIHEVEAGQSLRIGPLTVTAVEAVHDGGRDPWSRTKVRALGYRISSPDRNVYFAGDTELFDGMSELGPLDLALLPVWGWGPSLGSGHMDPEAAVGALELLKPRLAVPIHWGTFYPVGLRHLRPTPPESPAREFRRLAAERAPDVDARILEPGEQLNLAVEPAAL